MARILEFPDWHVASCRRSWNVSPWTPAFLNTKRKRREPSAVVLSRLCTVRSPFQISNSFPLFQTPIALDVVPWLLACLSQEGCVAGRIGRESALEQAQRILRHDLRMLSQNPIETAREGAVAMADGGTRKMVDALHRPFPGFSPVVVECACTHPGERRTNRIEQFDVGLRDGVLPQVLGNAAASRPSLRLRRRRLEKRREHHALHEQTLCLSSIPRGGVNGGECRP